MIHQRRATLACLLACIGLPLLPAPGNAQSAYPSQPITLVVPFQPGGGTDAVARTFAKVSDKYFPKGMIVLNKSGAGGAVGWKYVLNQKPDGYTLAVVTGEFVTLPLLNLFDRSYKDYTPLVQLNADPTTLVVHNDSPYKTVEDFLEAARKNPNGLNVGTPGTGAVYDVALSAFEVKSGTQVTHVPYPGSGPSLLALLGNQVDAVATSPAEAAEYVRGGKMRLLVVMDNERVAEFRDVPTAREKGIDVSYGTWRGIAGPKHMPPEAVKVLKDAFEKMAQEPELVNSIKTQNLGYVYADGEAFEKKMAKETEGYAKVLKELNLK